MRGKDGREGDRLSSSSSSSSSSIQSLTLEGFSNQSKDQDKTREDDAFIQHLFESLNLEGEPQKEGNQPSTQKLEQEKQETRENQSIYEGNKQGELGIKKVTKTPN